MCERKSSSQKPTSRSFGFDTGLDKFTQEGLEPVSSSDTPVSDSWVAGTRGSHPVLWLLVIRIIPVRQRMFFFHSDDQKT